MKAELMWKKFKDENNIDHDNYDAWAFGVDADLLANLVLKREKIATSSAYPLYEIEREQIPKIGEYSVILNSKDEAICITKTTKVYVINFDEVSPEHAFKEGEGDKSLDYWRRVHTEFFTKCMKEVNLIFSNKMKVICEEFEVVFVE